MKIYSTTQAQNTLSILALLMTALFLFVGCDLIEDKDDPDKRINPTDVNAISEVLKFQSGTSLTDGNPPSAVYFKLVTP